MQSHQHHINITSTLLTRVHPAAKRLPALFPPRRRTPTPIHIRIPISWSRIAMSGLQADILKSPLCSGFT